MGLAKERYGGHFEIVMRDLHESNDPRILDHKDSRAVGLFTFDELFAPTYDERPKAASGFCG